MNIWDILLITPLTTALFFLYGFLGQNMGLAIIALTVILRIVLFPLTLPSLRMVKLQQEIQPQLEKMKRKYKGDRVKQSQAQMELFRQKGINPLAGCLPQILQLVLLIALYQVLLTSLGGGLNNNFLLWDLSQKDPYFVLPLLAAASQFILSRMMLPQVSKEHAVAHAAKEKTEDFATAFQRQNLFLFPLMTFIFGIYFPSGLMLYWLVSTVLQIPQQWWVTRGNVVK